MTVANNNTSKTAQNKGGLFIVIMLLPLGKEHLQNDERAVGGLSASALLGQSGKVIELTEISDG
jgi:hypothetical protein